jgi:hypothetical protein
MRGAGGQAVTRLDAQPQAGVRDAEHRTGAGHTVRRQCQRGCLHQRDSEQRYALSWRVSV